MLWINSQIGSVLIGAIIAFMFNKYNDYKKELSERISLLYSLYSEVNTLIALVELRKSEFKLPSNNNLDDYDFPYFPVSYNYFTVYESSAGMIGSLENRRLMDCIICAYVEVKGLFENVKDLTDLSKMFIKYFIENPDSDLNRKLIQIHYEYSKHILEKQVPTSEKALRNLSCALSNEIDVCEKKNGIWSFICYFFKIW